MSVSFLQYNSYQCQPIVVGDMVIESVKSFRFLGLHISCDLTWSVHCDFVLKSAYRRLYALRKLEHSGVPPSDLVQVYCALVRSTIKYSSAIYSSLPSYLADLIECIQKRALRIIFPQHSYNKALEETELSTLYDRRSEACKRFIKSINIVIPFSILLKMR